MACDLCGDAGTIQVPTERQIVSWSSDRASQTWVSANTVETKPCPGCR
jgi:hypothetical protein